MKIYKNLARITAVAAAFTTIATSVSAHSDFLIMMDALRSPVPEIVDFSSHTPVVTGTDLLVPIRPLANEAGMFTSWDQPTQTATITLYSCAWGENKVERHAAELMNNVNTYGLDISPYSITADFTLNETSAMLRFNYKDSDDDIISLGKEVEIAQAATLVDDGTLMVPLESSMELFGLDVDITAEAGTAKISIPEYLRIPSDMGFVSKKAEPVEISEPTTSVKTVEEDAPVNTDPSLGTYLGRFKITHYCTCSKCNGGYGNNTAWAGKIKPGQTIAVDPTVIPKLATVYIDGYGYRRAEDCGGAIKGNRIDLAVSSHAEAMSKGVVWADVYLTD